MQENNIFKNINELFDLMSKRIDTANEVINSLSNRIVMLEDSVDKLKDLNLDYSFISDTDTRLAELEKTIEQYQAFLRQKIF